MLKPDWQRQTYSLTDLRQRAKVTRHYNSVFGWLKAQGYVPESVEGMRVANPKSLDPEAIEIGYLAAVAYEWDSWGPTSPLEFLDAMEFECIGNERRDIIVETLTALGSEKETSNDLTVKVHWP